MWPFFNATDKALNEGSRLISSLLPINHNCLLPLLYPWWFLSASRGWQDPTIAVATSRTSQNNHTLLPPNSPFAVGASKPPPIMFATHLYSSFRLLVFALHCLSFLGCILQPSNRWRHSSRKCYLTLIHTDTSAPIQMNRMWKTAFNRILFSLCLIQTKRKIEWRA